MNQGNYALGKPELEAGVAILLPDPIVCGMKNPKNRLSPEATYDQRTALVRDMLVKESAAQDAKTIRLRALRMAKEAEDMAKEPEKKPAKKPAPKTKVKVR
jgi:hypothetical protein